MPKFAKKAPNKTKEFDAYIVWKSLPGFLRGQPDNVLAMWGVTDPLSKELLLIKSQTDFASKYGIGDLGTLTDWNTRIVEENLMQKYMNTWAAERLPDAVKALTQRVIRLGRGSDFRVWVEYMEGWPIGRKHGQLIRELKRKVSALEVENMELREELGRPPKTLTTSQLRHLMEKEFPRLKSKN